jgi:4-amino-4-deoxy-L-arabinose transferase-like glycosyltransferase
MAGATPETARQSLWRTVILMTVALTIVRLMVLFASPLELYPDEAQYWLWSRTLDFGYYSKPPMIAWAIWATTAIGGDAEAWVRASSPLFHAGATLAVFGIGRRLYGESAALAAAAVYALMPGVQLSSAVVATDAPLLFFLGVTLLAYVTLPHLEGRRRVLTAAGFGAALGLAFLSKYAALYGIIGLALHLAISREARSAWRPSSALAAVAAFVLVLTPNLVWNAQHDFATVQHTAENAAWGGRKLFNPQELGEFVLSQFGVFGPIPFAALIGGATLLTVRRKLAKADLLLLCFTLPPLLIVAGQAFVSRANANWSGAGYLPGAILVAAWLMRWRARRWLIAALAIQAAVAALFLAFTVEPKVAEAMGASNSFKRAKGWSQMTQAIVARARIERRAGGLSAIAVNDRFLYNAMAYYGRDYFARANAPPLKVWLLKDHPQNQAERTDPLTPALGARVLAVSLEQVYRDEMAADFKAVSGQEITSVRLDHKRRRRAELFIGQGFSPQPRDPVSGLPRRP